MRKYNHLRPLIFIHTPKTAGTAVREIVRAWFPNNFKLHYYDHINATMPRKLNLLWLRRIKGPLVIYGHFNRERGFGVEDYYPGVRQFMTILRDPFEAAVSGYFFSRKVGFNHAIPPKSLVRTLEDDLMTEGSLMLNYFPREVTQDNYKDIIEEYFIAIGVTESLSLSLKIMAAALEKGFDESSLRVENATHRDQDVPSGLRDRFCEANRLEFEVYDYVRSRIDSQSDAGT